MDYDIKPMQGGIYDLKGPSLNSTSAKEHAPEIEQISRVLKELTIDLTILLSYKALSRRMVSEVLKFIVLWLNAFPYNRECLPPSSPGESSLGLP